MFFAAWERLRGYDRWIETQAVLESAKVTEKPTPGSPVDTTSTDTLVWADQRGQRHSAEVTVPEDSPLFKLRTGQTVTIRYDPGDPGRFYLRELLRIRLSDILVTVIVWIVIGIVIVVYLYYVLFVRNRFRHYLW